MYHPINLEKIKKWDQIKYQNQQRHRLHNDEN